VVTVTKTSKIHEKCGEKKYETKIILI
jgi:hypothetical protein